MRRYFAALGAAILFFTIAAPAYGATCDPLRINDYDTVHKITVWDTDVARSIRADVNIPPSDWHIENTAGNANYLQVELRDNNGNGWARLGWDRSSLDTPGFGYAANFYLRDSQGAVRSERIDGWGAGAVEGSRLEIYVNGLFDRSWHFAIRRADGSVLISRDWDIAFLSDGFTPTRGGVSFSMHSRGNQFFGDLGGKTSFEQIEMPFGSAFSSGVIQTQNGFAGMKINDLTGRGTGNDIVKAYDGDC